MIYIKKPRIQFLQNDNSHDWDEELITLMILLLHQSMRRFSIRSMDLHIRPTPDPILSSFLGRDCSRKFLYHAACVYFGSWNSALEEAGIKTTKSPSNKFWSSSLIIKCIEELRSVHHPLTVKAIWRDRSTKTSNVLSKVVGKKTTGSSLHDAARRIIGSWDKALMEAGIDVQSVKEKPFWSKSKVISVIHVLHKSGIPLNAKSISRNKNRLTKNLIEQKIGKPRTGRSLFGGAYRAFGSWDRALSEAGICSKDIRQVDFFWKKSSIKRILRILSELDVPINSNSLRSDNSEQTKEIVYNYTGQMECGSKIYRVAYKLHGRWDEVLKHSGFKLSHIRKCGLPCEKNKEKIVKYIRLLSKNEYSLNHSALKRQTDKMMLLTEDNFGSPITGNSLLVAAAGIFGSWNEALWEAGLDPSAITLRSRTRGSSLPVTLGQREDVQVNGERRISRFAGNPTKSPEDLLAERESAADLNSIMNSLSSKDRELAETIFDTVLQIHHYKNQDDLIKHIVMKTDKNISEGEIKELFSRMVLAKKSNQS